MVPLLTPDDPFYYYVPPPDNRTPEQQAADWASMQRMTKALAESMGRRMRQELIDVILEHQENS